MRQNKKIFRQQASSFFLQVTKTKQELQIELRDLRNYIIYNKSYDNKFIKQKCTIINIDIIFSQLSRNFQSNDAQAIRKQNQQDFIKYQFGNDIIKNNYLCYKIQWWNYHSIQANEKFKQLNSKLLNIITTLIVKINELNLNTYLKIKCIKKINKIDYAKIDKSVIKQSEKNIISNNINKKEIIITIIILAIEYWSFSQGPMSIYNQPYRNKFIIACNKVQYTGQNGSFTQFIFNKKISVGFSQPKADFLYHDNKKKKYNKIETFRIKINYLNTSYLNLIIGLIDFDKQKYQRSSYSSGNAVAYYGYSGTTGNVYPGGKAVSYGFKTGEIIKVKINRKLKNIKWSVENSHVKSDFNCDILGEENRVFMAYVEMSYSGDSIQWLQ